MNSTLASFTNLLAATALLFIGVGLLVTILPIRGLIEGFSAADIGLVGAAHFLGFALGCLLGPSVVRRVGHIRTFAGFAAIAATSTLVLPVLIDLAAWTVLRALSGCAFAVLYLVIESWLNDRAANEIRGRVLSIYIIVANITTMGGQLAVDLNAARDDVQFMLAAALVTLSLVPLALTNPATPRPIARVKLNLAMLYRLSPVGMVGCALVGIIEGAFWTLGPVFAQQREIVVSEVVLFMGTFMLGGTISQWPLGRLSDHIDRRWVIAACSFGTICTGMLLALEPIAVEEVALYGLALLHGAFMVPLYPLLVAHVNDYAPNERLVQISSELLLVYAAGAVGGPLAIGWLMDEVGPGALFLAMAVLLALFLVFIAYRASERGLAAAIERIRFVPVPKTSQSVYSLEQSYEEDEG